MRPIRERRSAAADIPTSSLADVAFLLLVFFVLTATFAVGRGLDFHLDEIEPDEPVQVEESVFVEVLADSTLRVDGRPLPLDGLLAYLHPKLQRNPGKPVILQTADQAPYGAMINVFDVLRSARTELDLEQDVSIALPTRREIETFW